jgi:hypothetical protein
MIKRIVALITFFGGLYYLAEFILPGEIGGVQNPLSRGFGVAGQIVIVLTGMAFLLGPLNLLKVHVGTLVKARSGAGYSAVFVGFFVVGLVLAILNAQDKTNASALVQQASAAYEWLFYGLLTAFGATSMGLLAFYLVSAAYRSFRLHTLDAAVMMVSASIVLLGLTPLGAYLTHALPEWMQLPVLAGWILSTPNTAVQRAVVFGTCAGAFAAGMRHWLSIGAKPE